MGVPASKPLYARPRNGPDRLADRGSTPQIRARRKRTAARLIGLCLSLLPHSGFAETIRVATWHVELRRDGPGLLLRDIRSGSEDVAAVLQGVLTVRPDILLLTGIDWDHGGETLEALRLASERSGVSFPFAFALPPNSGFPSGADLDGDGRLGTPRDAHGYGRFPGHGAMALLSRFPIDRGRVQTFTDLLWRDLPDAKLPNVEGALFPSPAAYDVQRLSSVGHWVVPVDIGARTSISLLTFAAGAPVFDGPEDRNGLRNADEIRLWTQFLEGRLDTEVPGHPVVVVGLANLDPFDGDGIHTAIRTLLEHPRLTDTEPAALPGAGPAPNPGHVGPPSLDTADWSDDTGPGNLRVSYVLPDRALCVRDTGLYWAPSDAHGEEPVRHAMVWVDLTTGCAYRE